jgi:hypothetical protein
MPDPGTIAVNVELRQEVFATRVALHVEIRGDSLFAGDSALTKAHEVRDLAEALAAVGVSTESIQVVGVSAEVQSGMIGKSSSAV